MTTPSVEHAVREAHQLARELGHDVAPTVLADRSNLVLALGDVVARVAMATSMVRIGMAWLRREVEISRFLDAAGGSVTRPARSLDAGPHERGGLVISFWERETIASDRADAREAGRGLAQAHRLLASYPKASLQTWGSIEEAGLVLERARACPFFDDAERARLDRAWEHAMRIVERAAERTASFQAVHGDAHIANVLDTARGTLWTDWEDAFVGPVEWDLACLRSKAELFGEEREAIEAMTRAYDGPWNEDLARDLGVVRNLQVVLWLAVFAERQPELMPRMRARLEHLP